MARKTKKAYEEYLDRIGATLEDCEYMSNPDRGKCLKKNSIRSLINDERYGYLLRNYDPIAFETGYNDWSRN